MDDGTSGRRFVKTIKNRRVSDGRYIFFSRFISRSCNGLLRRCLVGGNWSNGSYCSSRAANCNNFSSYRNATISGRAVSDMGVYMHQWCRVTLSWAYEPSCKGKYTTGEGVWLVMKMNVIEPPL